MRAAPALDVVIAPSLGADWPKDGVGSVAAIIAALPDPATLAPGAIVGVLAGGEPQRGLGRLFRAVPAAHLGVRCAALLAKGYVEVGAGRDADGREVAFARAQ